MFSTACSAASLENMSANAPIDFGNARRVAAAEHIDGLVAFERVAEVVHQLQDAAVLREFFAECRELHVKLSVCKADWFVRYAV